MVTPQTITRIEKDAQRDLSRQFSNEQIDAFSRVSKIDRWVCYFWAGRLPPEIYELPESGLSNDNLIVGLALLAAAVGGISIGPDISHDAAALMGFLGNTAEDRVKAELAALNGSKLTMSNGQKDRVSELSEWLKQRHKAPADDESVRAVLHAWGKEAVEESRS